MPQDACHAKSSTKLLKLNNRIALAHIADSKRNHTDDSGISISSPYDVSNFYYNCESSLHWAHYIPQ